MKREITAVGPHKITAEFEAALCDYTGAPFAVAVDSETSALELCLWHENVKGAEIQIPERTYMSVVCAVI